MCGRAKKEQILKCVLGWPFSASAALLIETSVKNLTTILLSSVCLDVQSASSSSLFAPQIPTTQRHRPANYRLPEAAKKSWELLRKSCPEFPQRLDRIGKTYVAHVTRTCQSRGRGFLLRPSVPHTAHIPSPLTPYIQRRTNLANSHCLNLKWPDWRPMAPAGGGKGGGTTSGWNNRKRKYLNIRHALKTHCIGQWYQPRYIDNRIGFQIHQRTTCGESSSWSGSWRWAITGDKSWSA